MRGGVLRPSTKTKTQFRGPLRTLIRKLDVYEAQTARWAEFGPEGFEYGSGTNLEHQRRIEMFALSYGYHENDRRTKVSEAILDIPRLRLLARRHDTHEFLSGDLPHGTKSTRDKDDEKFAYDLIVEYDVTDPELRSTAQELKPYIFDPYASLEGRFFKAIEQIDHLDVALCVRDQAIRGGHNNITNPDLLVWDVLYNNLPKLIRACEEFPALTSWLTDRRDELIAALDEFHSDWNQTLQSQQRMTLFSPKRSYPSADEMMKLAAESRRVLEQLAQKLIAEPDFTLLTEGITETIDA